MQQNHYELGKNIKTKTHICEEDVFIEHREDEELLTGNADKAILHKPFKSCPKFSSITTYCRGNIQLNWFLVATNRFP